MNPAFGKIEGNVLIDYRRFNCSCNVQSFPQREVANGAFLLSGKRLVPIMAQQQ